MRHLYGICIKHALPSYYFYGLAWRFLAWSFWRFWRSFRVGRRICGSRALVGAYVIWSLALRPPAGVFIRAAKCWRRRFQRDGVLRLRPDSAHNVTAHSANSCGASYDVRFKLSRTWLSRAFFRRSAQYAMATFRKLPSLVACGGSISTARRVLLGWVSCRLTAGRP